MSTPSTTPILTTRRFPCPEGQLFDAWLDPQNAGRWLFATPTGTMRKVEIDGRVGGGFAIVERRAGVDVQHLGTYLEMVRPRRIVFAFDVGARSASPTRVSLDIERFGAGCELVLRHEGVPPEHQERTRAGWVSILDALAVVLGEPRPGAARRK